MSQHGTGQFLRFLLDRKILAMVFCGVIVGCGSVGTPVPPEETGINIKLLKEQQIKTENGSTPQEIAPIGEDSLALPF